MTMPAEWCSASGRADQVHSWRFGDDYQRIICIYCDEMRDARTGATIRVARHLVLNSPSPQADTAPCGEDTPSALSRDAATAEGRSQTSGTRCRGKQRVAPLDC